MAPKNAAKNDNEVLASFLVRVTIRATGGMSGTIPTVDRMIEIVEQAVTVDSDFTTTAKASAERTDI